jgi:hypothetical protein
MTRGRRLHLVIAHADWRFSVNVHGIVKDALIGLAMLNLIVCVAVAGSTAYSWRQKLLQMATVWIIPVVGAILIGVFMLTQRGQTVRMGYPSESDVDVGQIWSGTHPPDQKQ